MSEGSAKPHREGPLSQIRALKTMRLFAILMKPTTVNEVKSLISPKS